LSVAETTDSQEEPGWEFVFTSTQASKQREAVTLVSFLAVRRQFGRKTTISPGVVLYPLPVLAMCTDYNWNGDYQESRE
jgi:hypothetical protein